MDKQSLYQAMEAYISRNTRRMHTPGHKGRLPYPLDGAAPYDLTELSSTDCLYAPTGPIAQLEKAYAHIYGAEGTLLSTGGSTLCIQAMLAAYCPPMSSVIMGRNAHVSAVNALALLDLRPIWLYPEEESGPSLPGRVTARQVEAALLENPHASAVYLTTPDYYGVLCDVGAIADICRSYGTPLLVDNAHGAHLFSFGLHPIGLGAAACSDSLHKTLPALTGAALLHINGEKLPTALQRMAMFGSTSPSFLIMLSADMLLPRLEEEIPNKLFDVADRVARIRKQAAAKGIWGTSGLCDPCRICLHYAAAGYDKQNFYDLLVKQGIEPEYLSETHCVLLPDIEGEDIAAVAALIETLPAGQSKAGKAVLPRGNALLTPRQAAFSSAEEITVENTTGRIAARVTSICPPGLPLLMPGEVITDELKKNLEITGAEMIYVVK